MKIAVTANGPGLDARTSPVLGRCPTFILVDVETMQFQAIDNPALSSSGGAGVQAAQFVIERGAQAVVTGNVGPNAYGVFQAAQIPVYLFGEGTVGLAVEAYKAGRLRSATGATVAQHSGLGRGAGRRRRGQ